MIIKQRLLARDCPICATRLSEAEWNAARIRDCPSCGKASLDSFVKVFEPVRRPRPIKGSGVTVEYSTDGVNWKPLGTATNVEFVVNPGMENDHEQDPSSPSDRTTD